MVKAGFNIASTLSSGGNALSILIYHRVLEKRDPLRPDTIDVKRFEQHLQWVSRYFRVMPLTQAVDKLVQGCLPPRALAITFDDGYLDNATVALPVLKKYDLPASFYVSSEFVGGNCMWIDPLIEAVRQTSKQSCVINGVKHPLQSTDERTRFCLFVENYKKSLSREQGDAFLEQLINELGPQPVERLLMAESEIRHLIDSGMEIGAHGKHHYILSQVSDDEAEKEIVGSKQDLESVLDIEITGFAYPNGKFPNDFHDTHANMVKGAGYRYALSTNNGCSRSKEDLFHIRRYTPWRGSKWGFLANMLANYFDTQSQDDSHGCN